MINPTRKQFLLAGLSFIGLAGLFKLKSNEEPKKNTTRFLTKDGKLVDVDIDKLTSSRTATQSDIKNWIRRAV